MKLIARCLPGLFLFAIGMIVLPSAAHAQAIKKDVPLPIQTFVPTTPVVFHADGGSHLCYEIFLTNLSKDAWILQSITPVADDGSAFPVIDGKNLQTTLEHPGRPTLKDDALFELAPGERVVVFVWINLSGPAPKELKHELVYKRASGPQLFEMTAGKTAVSTTLPAIAAPLRGKNWVAANGPSNKSLHRRTIIVIAGTPHLAQRFAIDWVQADDKGLTHRGDKNDNHSYYCYGSEALAVADATVVEVKDGIPENTPGGGPLAVEINLDTIAGNHVNLDLGNGVFAMYAHLQPGSLRVKVGDKVSSGQVIGLVGNTGNSSEPHLHFQLMDHNSPLGSEGMPYAMDYQLTGHAGDIDVNPKLERISPPQAVHGSIPAEDEVVDF